jgi:site-specific recombinase XerD
MIANESSVDMTKRRLRAIAPPCGAAAGFKHEQIQPFALRHSWQASLRKKMIANRLMSVSQSEGCPP